MTVAHAERITRLREIEAFLLAKAFEFERRGLDDDAADFRRFVDLPAEPETDWTGIEPTTRAE